MHLRTSKVIYKKMAGVHAQPATFVLPWAWRGPMSRTGPGICILVPGVLPAPRLWVSAVALACGLLAGCDTSSCMHCMDDSA